MSTYHYLAREDNKTLFELGKGCWSCNKLFEFKVDEPNIIDHNYEDYYCIDITNREKLEQYVAEGLGIDFDYLEEFDLERLKILSDKIEKFCGGKYLYWCVDTGDLYTDLKYDHGYKEVDSRYVENL